MHRLGLALALACSPILLGCPAQTPEPPPPPVVRGNPPAAPSANPHGQPANPHAGLDMPAADLLPVTPVGPPRDVTPTGTTRTEIVDGLALQVPEEWKFELPANTSMRKAEFVIPGPGGDVRMIVFRMAGGAGGLTANIERWKAQMTAPAGVEPTIVERTIGDLKLASIDVPGKYAGQTMPGAPPQPAVDDARLLAVAIEKTGADPWYLKIVGAKPTIDVWAPAWETLLGSLAAAPAPAAPAPAAPAPAAPAPAPAP